MHPTARTLWILTLAAVSLAVSAHPVLGASAELVAQARQALDANKVDEAIALLEQAVATDAGDPAALAWLGSAQVRKARTVFLLAAPGWVKKGFNTLDEAVERFPNAFVVYMVRGTTAVNVPETFRKTPVALQDLRAVIAMRDKDPTSVPETVMPSVYLNLGRAYRKAGQPAEARAAWEKGRQLYPSAPETPAIANELRGL